MTIIGDPTVFATQVSWNREIVTYKPWMYGVFCVYIGGEMIGSAFDQVTLNSILAELDGWKEGIVLKRRQVKELMNAGIQEAFFSIENGRYGLDHMRDQLPPGFQPIPVPDDTDHQILQIDGLEHYKIYCIDDESISRLIYARDGEFPKEFFLPRATLTAVLLRTIDTLDGWYRQLPEESSR